MSKNDDMSWIMDDKEIRKIVAKTTADLFEIQIKTYSFLNDSDLEKLRPMLFSDMFASMMAGVRATRALMISVLKNNEDEK